MIHFAYKQNENRDFNAEDFKIHFQGLLNN